MQRRSTKVLFAVLTSLVIAACARTQMPRPTTQQAAQAQTRFPGLTVAELDRGRSLYMARCSVCHQPVLPTRIPADEWPGHVEEMRERAHLSVGEARLVESYLVTSATVASR